MCGYIAFYKDKQHEIYTDKGIYAVKCEAAQFFKAKRTSDIIIMLAEKDNQCVIHKPEA